MKLVMATSKALVDGKIDSNLENGNMTSKSL